MIFGLTTSEPFPENWTPLEGVAVVKCLDHEGNLAFLIRSTPDLTDWECYGLLEIAAAAEKRDILDNFENEEPEEFPEEEEEEEVG